MKSGWTVLFVCSLAAPLQGFGVDADPLSTGQGSSKFSVYSTNLNNPIGEIDFQPPNTFSLRVDILPSSAGGEIDCENQEGSLNGQGNLVIDCNGKKIIIAMCGICGKEPVRIKVGSEKEYSVYWSVPPPK